MTKDETIKQLIEDLISAMEYHVEQTRPVHMTTVAIQAAKDALNSMPTAPVQDQIRAITQEAMQKIHDLEDQVRREVYNIPPAAPVQEPVTTLFGSLPVYDTPPVQEPAGWRPATCYRENLTFNPGLPDDQTVKFWRLQGVEIEYCYTTPPAQPAPVHEPVACDGDFPEGFDASFGIPAQALRQANAALCEVTNNRMWDVPALAERMMRFRPHTTPPAAQRQWVSLTDEDIAETDWHLSADREYEQWTLQEQLVVCGVKDFARAIEAKLRSKNGY